MASITTAATLMQRADVLLGEIGHKMPDEIARNVNAIQRYLVTETRLKILAIFHNEALNGEPTSLLAYTSASGNLVMEPGPVEFSAGSNPLHRDGDGHRTDA